MVWGIPRGSACLGLAEPSLACGGPDANLVATEVANKKDDE